MQFRRKRRFYRSLKERQKSVSIAWLLMIAGYLIGCIIGACVAIKADTAWMTSVFADSVDISASDLLSSFCGYSIYCFGMLLLATSYLGFLLVPGVLGIKGFLSACVFTAGVREAAAGALYRAVLEMMIPGVFLLPMLLILGRLCMNRSVRLLRCRTGESTPPGAAETAPFGISLILLLMASAAKTYFVPFMLSLI